jgi:hypothetical protein
MEPEQEHMKKDIKELESYAIKFTMTFVVIIVILFLIKKNFPKRFILKNYHPYIYFIAIYICTFLFGVIDNAIIIYDNNHLEDLLAHYLNDELMATLWINIFTAGISLYIGAGIQDIMGLMLNQKIDPTAAEYSIGLILGGSLVILLYYLKKIYIL